MGKMNELSLVVDRVNELTEGFFQCSEAEQEARRNEYKTVLQPALLAAYGVDGPAHMVDPWMADTYSDLHKDRYGFRPREHRYSTMKAFMDNVPPLEDFLDEEEEPEGDRFDPDISGWPEADLAFDDSDVRDFEEVYGVSAMGQAMRLSGGNDFLRDY